MKGRCSYCNKELNKSGVLKHLKTCQERQEYIDSSVGIIQKENTRFILCVYSKYEPDDYWLYVAIDENATLEDLDMFLSDISLESSRNSSKFKINGEMYISSKNKHWFNQENLRTTDTKVKSIIDVGYKIEYDFGNNTYLEIKVLDKFIYDKRGKKVELMAKNDEFNIDEELDFIDEFHIEDYLLREAADKFMNKRWKKIKKDFSLDYHLSKLGKKELLIIGENLNINKLSSLKKEDLKNKIIGEYQEKLNIYLENMDEERFKYILELANEGGYRESKDMMNEDIVYYFSKLGIIFTGNINDRFVLIMPEEVQNLVSNRNNSQFMKQLKRNEEVIRLFWGMCYYYGAIEVSQFKRLVKGYIDYDISNININFMFEDAAKYYDEFEFEGDLGNDSAVLEPRKILEEHGKRADLEFYPFKKEELLKVAKIDYTDESMAYKRMHDFLSNNFDMEDEDAKDLIVDLTYDIKNNETTDEVIAEFLRNFDIDDIELANIISMHVLDFAENTRQWAIKGYTPEELSKASRLRIKEEKVRRNDSCPCGSGKKYKECCASNVIYLKR